MQIVTLLIAVFGSLMICLLKKPIHSLCVFLMGICWYPQFLTVSIGSVDFTVGRIIIIVLLVKILLNSDLWVEFKWNLIDTLVIVYILFRLIAISTNVPVGIFIQREGGEFFETVLPYFAARLIINSKDNLLTFIKALVIIAIPLAIFGLYQSVTGNNPVGFLVKHYAWGLNTYFAGPPQRRHGLYRATVTMGIHIIFGLFFAGIAPLCLGLWNQLKLRSSTILISCSIMILGVISSMSSGPIFSLAVSLLIVSCFPFRRTLPVILFFVIASIIFIELYSNRHWYEVLTRFAFSLDNAYYRIGLLEEAFGGGMTGHWTTGFGYVGVGVGNDNSNFHWFHQDIVNIYLVILVRYGLLGLLPFIAITFLYYNRLFNASTLAQTGNDIWLVWCIISALIGWNVAMMTVSAMGQVSTLLFMIIGICCNLPGFIIDNDSIQEKSSYQFACP